MNIYIYISHITYMYVYIYHINTINASIINYYYLLLINYCIL